MVSRYEEKYPNVQVELIGIPYEQMKQQTIVRVSGGNPPDLLHLVAQWGPPLAGMGALVDLKQYYSSDELDNMVQAAYRDGLYQDQLITVPWQLGAIAVMGWKSVLEDAGLSTEIPDTWNGYKEAVAKVSDQDAGVYGFGARTSKSANSAFWFFPVMWGHGGEFEDDEGNIVFNNPGTVDALNWYKTIGQKKYTPTGMGVREVRNLMGQGKVGYIFDGPWMKGIFRNITGEGEAADDMYVTGLFPKAPDGNRYGIGNNHVFAISQQSEVKQEAVNMIKYFTQNEEITKFYYDKMGAVPTYNDLLQDPLYQDDPFARAIIESAKIADSVPSKDPNFQAALEFVANAMQTAILGGDVEEAAAKAEESIKTLYNQ
jgi:multiple sugar transport system substrate-binding protein